MKKFIFISLAFFIFFTNQLFAQEKQSTTGVSVQFDFNRKQEFSTNQFAVWVETLNGEMVKTLFVTSFTTGKGWNKRAASLPTWRKIVKTDESISIDTLSGATPKAGRVMFHWDLKNQKGETVPQGSYRLKIEANIKKENCVLFACEIAVDKTVSIGSIIEQVSNEAYSGQQLITNVSVDSLQK